MSTPPGSGPPSFDGPQFQPPAGYEPPGGQGPVPGSGGGPFGSPGTQLYQLRILTGALIAAPVLLWLPIVFAVPGGSGSSLPLAVACAVIVAAALPALLVGPRVPRPLPVDGRQRQPALAALRQALMLRFALAEAVPLIGMVLCFVTQSLVPYAVGFAIGWPLLCWLVWPRTALIESVRRRLEADGAQSDLWEQLLGPAPAGGRR